MSDGMLLQLSDDGKAEVYDDTYDIIIHCKSKEEQDAAREFLKHANDSEHWIPIGKDMPDEYDSVFKRFHGTDKWRDGMWLKSSAKVLVTVEFEDGTRLTETAKTIDGKWATENHIRKRKVIAWQKMPKEYKGK